MPGAQEGQSSGIEQFNSIRSFEVPKGTSVRNALISTIKFTSSDPDYLASKCKALGANTPEAAADLLMKRQLKPTGDTELLWDSKGHQLTDPTKFGFDDFVKDIRFDKPEKSRNATSERAHNVAVDTISKSIHAQFPHGFREFGIGEARPSSVSKSFEQQQTTSVLIDPETRIIVVMNRNRGM